MGQLLAGTVFAGLWKDEKALTPGSLWLQGTRRDDRLFLASVSIPSLKDREWQSSPLNALWTRPYDRARRVDAVYPEGSKGLLSGHVHQVMVFNGHIAQGDARLSGIPGISWTTGDAAFQVLEEEKRYFNALTPNDSEIFLRLNRVFCPDPLMLVVRQGVKVEGLVHIVHVVTDPGTAVFPRIFIRVGEGSSLNVLQTYVSAAEGGHLSVPVTDVVLEEGADLEYGERHGSSPLSSYIGSVRVWQKKDSSWRSLIATVGADLFRSNLSIMLEGPGASASMNGLHRLEGKAHADSHTFLQHAAPNTTSDQLYKCVLAGASCSVFNGRILVHRDAQKTKAYQLNRNLLLGSGCRADARPQLEIKADDVKCTHGATTSQLNEDQLFYFQTRAVDRVEAVRMLVRGFMDDVTLRVRNPLMREAFLKE